MIWRIVRSRGFIPVVLILAALIYWKLHPGTPKVISVGYVGDRDVILWNTLAQVRESVGEVHYGDRVEVVRVEGSAAQVRAPSGTIGWMRDSRQIMDSELWGKSASLLERARTLPIQARGRTGPRWQAHLSARARDARADFAAGRGGRYPGSRGKFARRESFRHGRSKIEARRLAACPACDRFAGERR
jgi:hypothetical protein